jgi:hypothetical protein
VSLTLDPTAVHAPTAVALLERARQTIHNGSPNYEEAVDRIALMATGNAIAALGQFVDPASLLIGATMATYLLTHPEEQEQLATLLTPADD